MKKNHLLTCKNHWDLKSQRDLSRNSFFGWQKLEYMLNLKLRYTLTSATQKTSCVKDRVEISSPDDFYISGDGFFFINHLQADTGKKFLIKATFGLKIPKIKKFQLSATQNLLGDSDLTKVGQKNPQTLYLSNRPILSK